MDLIGVSILVLSCAGVVVAGVGCWAIVKVVGKGS